MLLTLWRVLTIAVLTLPVCSVICDDLGEWYTEGLGYGFCKKREIRLEEEVSKERWKKKNTKAE